MLKMRTRAFAEVDASVRRRDVVEDDDGRLRDRLADDDHARLGSQHRSLEAGLRGFDGGFGRKERCAKVVGRVALEAVGCQTGRAEQHLGVLGRRDETLVLRNCTNTGKEGGHHRIDGDLLRTRARNDLSHRGLLRGFRLSRGDGLGVEFSHDRGGVRVGFCDEGVEFESAILGRTVIVAAVVVAVTVATVVRGAVVVAWTARGRGAGCLLNSFGLTCPGLSWRARARGDGRAVGGDQNVVLLCDESNHVITLEAMVLGSHVDVNVEYLLRPRLVGRGLRDLQDLLF